MESRAEVRQFLMSRRANLAPDVGPSLFADTAEPGSESRQKLQLLGSWSKPSATSEDRTQSGIENH